MCIPFFHLFRIRVVKEYTAIRNLWCLFGKLLVNWKI
jgi:hypothetical protein